MLGGHRVAMDAFCTAAGAVRRLGHGRVRGCWLESQVQQLRSHAFHGCPGALLGASSVIFFLMRLCVLSNIHVKSCVVCCSDRSVTG